MTLTGDELARFAAVIAAQLGLRVDLERSRELIERRAAHHREPIATYLERVAADPAERAALAGELTVGETYFLRHVEQCHAFADIVRDRLAYGPLRVLSAGCSSGEEPYTLAILLREHHPGARFAIHAIDLNPAAIARARAGRYSRWSLRATPPAFEQRWFQHDGDAIVVAPEIRAAVTFEQANLLEDSRVVAGRWDVVFCRNVMMYFTEEQADAAIGRIARGLAPDGYLFLGHAETLRGRPEFELRHTHGTFYYQRSSVPGTTSTRRSESRPEPAPIATVLDAGWPDDIREATRRVHAMVDCALDQVAIGPAPVVVAALDGSRAAPELGPIHDLVAQERFGEALERLDHIRATSPGNLDVALLRAAVLTHSGRLADARPACAELLAIDPVNAGANYLLALCCDSTGATAEAAQLARLAAELDPSFAMPHLHLGLLARRGGEREIASRELTRAIALLEREAPSRLALYGGGFSRQTLLGMCRAELAAIGGQR
jgi:chemotaxis protein methyltransferase CheR